jgi:hypothetical protein
LPIYPVVNKETGETKELEMTISQWEKWKDENFKNGWDRDWSQGCASPGEVGEWKNKLISKHPDWNTVLDRAGKMPKSNVKKI